jgi:hypothetical protein
MRECHLSALAGACHRALIEHVGHHILASDHDLARLGRNTRSAGKKALALLEHGLADYGISSWMWRTMPVF